MECDEVNDPRPHHPESHGGWVKVDFEVFEDSAGVWRVKRVWNWMCCEEVEEDVCPNDFESQGEAHVYAAIAAAILELHMSDHGPTFTTPEMN